MRIRRDRKGRLTAAAGLAVAVLCLAVTLSAAERQGPRIYLQESRFDLGTVTQGAVPEHVFEIKNVGDEVLEIGRVQPT
jgi:hypothetical protein